MTQFSSDSWYLAQQSRGSRPGARAPGLRGQSLARFSVLLVLGSLSAACGSEEATRTLEPIQVGMTSDMPPIFDDGEDQRYEVKLPVRLPIRAPSQQARRNARQNRVDPFDAYPTVVPSDYEIQVTWVLTNLDDEAHTVELLLDPWNEFGRYWPGTQIVDAERGEVLPNLSGIDLLRELKPSGAGEASRLRGTFSFGDMNELAIDFATAINIIAVVPPPPPDDEDAITPTSLVNHVFHRSNRSPTSPLTARYIPTVVPALIGFDIGFRATEPANLALEFVVEIKEIDRDRDRVLDDGESISLAFEEPTEYITLGAPGL